MKPRTLNISPSWVARGEWNPHEKTVVSDARSICKIYFDISILEYLND